MLFHYKYYKSQQALNLTHNELESVLAAVYGNHGPDTRLVADQIIIKLFMDVSYLNQYNNYRGIFYVLIDMYKNYTRAIIKWLDSCYLTLTLSLSTKETYL